MLKASYPSAWDHYAAVVQAFNGTINANVPQRRSLLARMERLECDLMLIERRMTLSQIKAKGRAMAKQLSP